MEPVLGEPNLDHMTVAEVVDMFRKSEENKARRKFWGIHD